MQVPCVYLPGPAPAVSVANTKNLRKKNFKRSQIYVEFYYLLLEFSNKKLNILKQHLTRLKGNKVVFLTRTVCKIPFKFTLYYKNLLNNF